MLLGVALGDAFGAGVEFQSADWIRDAHNVDFTRWVNMRGAYFSIDPFSSRNFFGGMYTDDTEMTVGLMKALIAEGSSVTSDSLVEHWRQEYFLARTHYLSTRLWGLLGVGRNGHGSMRWVYSGEWSIEQVRAFQRGRPIPGNAGPMRALPLAYLPEEQRLQAAVASSDATHPHPKSRIATYLVATAAAYLVEKLGEPKGIIQLCLSKGQQLKEICPMSYDADTLEYLRQVDALADCHDFGPRQRDLPLEVLCGEQPIGWATTMRGSPVQGLDSDAMHTLGVVLYLLKWSRNPMDALQQSVWIGGDVDSVAAIVLGALGAAGRLGFDEQGGLPMWMVDDLEAMEYLLQIADGFAAWAGKHL